MNVLRKLSTSFSSVLLTLPNDSTEQLRPTVEEIPCELRKITVTSRIFIGGLPEIGAEEHTAEGRATNGQVSRSRLEQVDGQSVGM